MTDTVTADATCKQSFSVNANIFVGSHFGVTDSTSEHNHRTPIECILKYFSVPLPVSAFDYSRA